MQVRAFLLVMLLTVTAVAGCLGTNEDDQEPVQPTPARLDAFGRTVTEIELSNSTVTVSAAMGALSEVRAGDAPLVVGLAPNLWEKQDGRLGWDLTAIHQLAPGESIEFLVPPAAEHVELILVDDGGAGGKGSRSTDALPFYSADYHRELRAEPEDMYQIPTPYHPAAALLNGAHVVELMEVMRDEYPYRIPGQPNYERAQDFFVQYLVDLGYEIVVKDQFGMNDLPQADGLPLGVKPQSLANVYAYRPGTGTPDRIIGFGGHYDMVENTKEAAFDDTSGTLMTLAMAKAFSEVETDVGLLFGLWGGEEDGILGSSFFAKSHPDIVAQMLLYINFDVAALTWPGPALHPDPMIISPGPDGPVADNMMAQAKRLMAAYIPEMPSELQIYEPIGEGQTTGEGGVNAQSDHTSFMSEGVPVYFPFTGNVSTVYALFHKPTDTLYNLTAYMATQVPITPDSEEQPLTAEEFALGRDLLARSMETYMGFAFYTTLEIDQGLWTPPLRV